MTKYKKIIAVGIIHVKVVCCLVSKAWIICVIARNSIQLNANLK